MRLKLDRNSNRSTEMFADPKSGFKCVPYVSVSRNVRETKLKLIGDRTFSIKRQGRLFKSRPRWPSVYSNLRLFRTRRLFIKCIFQPLIFWSSALKVYWIKNQILTSPLKNVRQCHQLCLISVNVKSFSIVTYLCETRKNCIGNCSTANVLRKQFGRRWCRGSCSMSSEKGKIMERFKELLLEKPTRWSSLNG